MQNQKMKKKYCKKKITNIQLMEMLDQKKQFKIKKLAQCVIFQFQVFFSLKYLLKYLFIVFLVAADKKEGNEKNNKMKSSNRIKKKKTFSDVNIQTEIENENIRNRNERSFQV